MKLLVFMFVTASIFSNNANAGLFESDMDKAERCYQDKVQSLSEKQRKQFKRVGDLKIKEVSEFGVKGKMVTVTVETSAGYKVSTGMAVSRDIGSTRAHFDYPRFNLGKCK